MPKVNTLAIVQKILEHLDESMDEEWVGMDKVSAQELGISEARWHRIIAMMLEEELIDGFIETTTYGSMYPEFTPNHPRITIRGLRYLEENSNAAKIYRAAKELRDWIPGL